MGHLVDGLAHQLGLGLDVQVDRAFGQNLDEHQSVILIDVGLRIHENTLQLSLLDE